MSTDPLGNNVHTLEMNTSRVENVQGIKGGNLSASSLQSNNPMQIHLIVQHVLENLSFKQLQQCRLVNKTFNTIANQIIKASAVCVIKNKQCHCESVQSRTTLNLDIINMLPTSFVIRNSNSCICVWNLQEMASQLSHYSSLMTKLTIDGVFLSRVETLMFAKFGSLTILNIDSNIPCVLPVQELSKIKELKLASNCSIRIPIVPESTCCPKLLSLINVKFVKVKSGNIVLNDIFNFQACTHLTLKFTELSDIGVAILLWKPLEFQLMDIQGVLLGNCDDLTGNVDSLYMDWFPSCEYRNFKNVAVRRLKTTTSVDKLDLLPTTVSNLNINLATKLNSANDQFFQICLPNLKVLKLTSLNPKAFLSIFGKFCQCLETVQFNFHPIFLENLPTCIKKVMLRNDGQVLSESIIQVETLVLDMYTLNGARRVSQQFQACNTIFKCSNDLSSVLVNLETFGALYFGPVKTESEEQYFCRNGNVVQQISIDDFFGKLKA